MAEPDVFLTVQEVADRLRVASRTIYRLLDEGALEGVRVGRNWRVSPEALERYLLTNTVLRVSQKDR
jgi:excisionase family DNA binding protein